MNTTNQKKFFTKIKTVWQRQQLLHSSFGILTLVNWLVSLLAVSILVDWLLKLPGTARGVMIVAIIAVALLKAWRLAWSHLKSFDPAHTALKIEEHFKNLKSILVTAVQFSQRQDQAHSADLCELTCKSAEETVRTLPLKETVRFSPLKKPSAIVSVIIIGIVVLANFNSAFLNAGVSRFLTPWAAVHYPTQTQLELAEKDIIVQEGQPVEITAKIGGVIPAKAIIALKTGESKPREYDLEIAEGLCSFKIKSAFRGFEYRLSAGDVKSKWHNVTVISAPKILEAESTVKYPAYTQKEDQVAEALTLTTIDGATISWQLKLDQAVKKASIHFENGTAIDMQVSSDGLTVNGTHKANASQAYHFKWTEKSEGFKFVSPHHFIQLSPDKSPRVELLTPAEDLYAIIGRQLDISFIARDDFGISKGAIIYRLNNLPEKIVELSDAKIPSGETFTSDWDYRKALPDLKIGDTVRLGVQVEDHFPAATGPNKSRSRQRKLTFVTEEDYLKKLEARKRRLLAKLQTVYRQERASFSVLSGLSPEIESFQQSCMLEAVRQDLVSERIEIIRQRMGVFINDVKANNISANFQINELNEVSLKLAEISTTYVNAAGRELRQLARFNKQLDSNNAAKLVNKACHEIASLVQGLGVKYASEVLARELFTATEIQTKLHIQTLNHETGKGTANTEQMVREQAELSAHLTVLFDDLLENPDFTGSAIAALRLSRLVKNLRLEKVEENMLAVAGLFKVKKWSATLPVQEELIDILKATVYQLQSRAEMNTLLKARRQLETLMSQQKHLVKAANAGQSASKQLVIFSQLRTVIIPRIPMSRPALLDEGLPLVDSASTAFIKLLANVQTARSTEIGDGQKLKEQQDAVTNMQHLIGMLNKRIDEMSQFGELFSLKIKIESKYLKIKELIRQQNSIIEQTEEALDDEKDLTFLVDIQTMLALEVNSYKKRKMMKSDNGSASALSVSLDYCLSLIKTSADQLKENEGDESIETQEKILGTLNGLLGKMKSDLKMLVQAISTSTNERSIAITSRYLSDIAQEQKDIVEDGKGASAEKSKKLAQVQRNLARSMNDIMATLAGPIDTNDMQSLMEFSQSTFGSAALSLESDKAADAVSLQVEAAALLKESAEETRVIAFRNSYIAEFLSFLYIKMAQAKNIYATQTQLNLELQVNDKLKIVDVLKRQQILYQDAKRFGDELYRVTKVGHFKSTASYMMKAITSLKSGKLKEAKIDMTRAELAINVEISEFGALMSPGRFGSKLGNVPRIRVADMTPAVELLLGVLDFSIHQRKLVPKLWTASAVNTAQLVAAQKKMILNSADLLKESDNHRLLKAAHLKLQESLLSFENNSKVEFYKQQRLAESYMRGFIYEYAHQYMFLGGGNGKKKTPFSAPPEEDLDIGGIQNEEFQMFAKVAVQGEIPDDKHTEWEVLGRRERAALNENFARELPLEYRKLLKDYYERLAK